MVPSTNLEAEVHCKVSENSLNECTAIQVERGIVVLLTLLPVVGGVWYPDVALGFLNKFFSQLLFVGWRSLVVWTEC